MSFNWPADDLTVKERVGVGTDAPSAKLEVKGDLKLNSGAAVGEFSSDGTFATPSNQSTPTTQAVKTYVDAQVTTTSTTFTAQIAAINAALATKADTATLATKADKGGSLTQDFQVNNLIVQNTVTAAKFQGDGSGLTGLSGVTQWVNGASGSISYSGGNVGIGTTTPSAKLTVVANSTTWNGWYEAIQFGQAAHSAITHPGGGLLFGLHSDRNFYFADTVNGRYIMSVNAGNSSVSINGSASISSSTSISGNTFIGGWIYVPILFGRSRSGFWSATDPKANLFVNGDIQFSGNLIGSNGGKGGFVMDQFVNKLGEDLEEGDVVVVSSNQVSLYSSPNSHIPIPEVDTTQQAYDTCVCGIVYEVYAELTSEANPEAGSEPVSPGPLTSEEMSQQGRTVIQPDQIGWMVTLGAYAHCKVDADIASIRIGDLLTTSPTKGHAQKVLDRTQAMGAIVGKALGSLEKGKGKIPVLVMLQ